MLKDHKKHPHYINQLESQRDSRTFQILAHTETA